MTLNGPEKIVCPVTLMLSVLYGLLVENMNEINIINIISTISIICKMY